MPPTTVLRPPTEEEARALRGSPPKFFGWSTGIVSGLCIFALTFLLILLGSPIMKPSAILPVALTGSLGVSIAWYVYVQWRKQRALRRAAARRAREVAVGHVKSTTYMIRDAIAVKEGEDEGLSFYLLLDDGRTLFLSGQYLYEPVEAGFPWTSFDLVQAPVGGWIIRLVQGGPALIPSRTRGPFTDSEYRSGAVPEDCTIAPRDFSAL